jgi:hypothetical protein
MLQQSYGLFCVHQKIPCSIPCTILLGHWFDWVISGEKNMMILFLSFNKLHKDDAFDGAPFCEETSEGRVQFMDLTVPQYGIPLYDWVISLEVAEHIPSKYESIYLDNLHTTLPVWFHSGI